MILVQSHLEANKNIRAHVNTRALNAKAKTWASNPRSRPRPDTQKARAKAKNVALRTRLTSLGGCKPNSYWLL